MTSVPKINYGNLRDKSKSKESDSSQQKIESSSELFSHMNQDNLKYIQNQIKQKHKKINHITLEKKSQSVPLELESQLIDREKVIHIRKIQNIIKQDKDEQQRHHYTGENIKVIKTQGEILKTNENVTYQSKKISEQAEPNKLSFDDLVSQAKSKRVPSIAEYYDEDLEADKGTGTFINFLSNYIEDLSGNHKNQVKLKNRHKKDNQASNKRKKQQFISQSQSQCPSQSSSIKDIQILKMNLVEEKLKNSCLAKQIQDYRNQQQMKNRRIERLQQFVAHMSGELIELRSMIENPKKPMNKFNRQNYDTFDAQIEGTQPSHRKNMTAFSLASHNARTTRNTNTHNQLKYLEREYQLFQQTGECNIMLKSRKSRLQ